MDKTKFIVSWALIFIILGLAFYWYEWRPKEIRSNCLKQIAKGFYLPKGDEKIGTFDAFEVAKRMCLLENGIKE